MTSTSRVNILRVCFRYKIEGHPAAVSMLVYFYESHDQHVISGNMYCDFEAKFMNMYIIVGLMSCCYVYRYKIVGDPVAAFISVGSGSDLTINMLSFSDSGQYACVAHNKFGTAVSSYATLTIYPTWYCCNILIAFTNKI